MSGDWPIHLKKNHTLLEKKLRCCQESQEAWHSDSWVHGAGQRPRLSFCNDGFNARLICRLCTWLLTFLEQAALKG